MEKEKSQKIEIYSLGGRRHGFTAYVKRTKENEKNIGGFHFVCYKRKG